jgi:RNA polymerase sigma-70 factor, ECF subfamily
MSSLPNRTIGCILPRREPTPACRHPMSSRLPCIRTRRDLESSRELDSLYSLAYEELRRLARATLRREVNASISPTTLVHEAWLKLRASRELRVESPLHFKRIAARAMRQVLVDAARRRRAVKRGDPVALVTFDEMLDHRDAGAEALLALDSALTDLARLHPRQAEMIESRYFGGLSAPEVASLMGLSEATIHRDWRAARAWLAAEIADGR